MWYYLFTNTWVILTVIHYKKLFSNTPPPPTPHQPKKSVDDLPNKTTEQLQGTLLICSWQVTAEITPLTFALHLDRTKSCRQDYIICRVFRITINWLIGAIIFIFNFLAMLSHRTLESMLFSPFYNTPVPLNVKLTITWWYFSQKISKHD